MGQIQVSASAWAQRGQTCTGPMRAAAYSWPNKVASNGPVKVRLILAQRCAALSSPKKLTWCGPGLRRRAGISRAVIFTLFWFSTLGWAILHAENVYTNLTVSACSVARKISWLLFYFTWSQLGIWIHWYCVVNDSWVLEIHYCLTLATFTPDIMASFFFFLCVVNHVHSFARHTNSTSIYSQYGKGTNLGYKWVIIS